MTGWADCSTGEWDGLPRFTPRSPAFTLFPTPHRGRPTTAAVTCLPRPISRSTFTWLLALCAGSHAIFRQPTSVSKRCAMTQLTTAPADLFTGSPELRLSGIPAWCRTTPVRQQPQRAVARRERTGLSHRRIQAGPSSTLHHLRRNARRRPIARIPQELENCGGCGDA